MFQFGAEAASNKLLVVLGCDKKDCLLLLRTTSIQRADRPDPDGCHADNSVYRFKTKTEPFDRRTWVQFEMPILREKREVTNAGANVCFSLNTEQIRAIINCYKRSPEICNWIAEYF